MSKGSNRRPTNEQAYSESFDRIFRKQRMETNEILVPEQYGKIVGVAQYMGSFIVATEYAVFWMDGQKLIPVPFEVEEITEQ